VLAVGVTALLTLGLVPASPAAAGPAPAGEEMVRLIVRTDSRADTRHVARRARADFAPQGARSAGRVRKLRAVALDVPRSAAAYVAGSLRRDADVRRVDVAHQRWLAGEPSDPDFARQRVYFDAVQAPAAWDRPAHSASDVRIAVVDSGIDVNHPDLAGKIAGTFNAVTGGTDVTDLVDHGTAVASVAAAATNNGAGMAGAGYDSSLLVAKVTDYAGRIFTDDLAAGIVWAVDSGADVINVSLGGDTSDELERDAIAYAQRHDVLVVTAAGNAGSSNRQFPAALDGVLSVGATTASGTRRASFSSYGPWVDVAAPGKDIVVATPGGGYGTAEGTSFSTPLVVGQVALLEGYRPDRSADELTRAVRSSTNGARLGFDQGLVSFAASLDLLTPATVPSMVSHPSGATLSGAASVTVSSSAPKVRLSLADLSQLVPVQNGLASATFDTYGLAGGQTLRANDCSALDFCAAGATTLPVTVSNPAPVLTAPVQGSDASDDTITASAEAAGGAVRFLIDGRASATDVSAPFTAALSTESLTDGGHTVAAVSCRSDGTVCDVGTATAVSVQTARLHPSITRHSPTVFSPGRDGRRDRTTLTYRLHSRQEAVLRVREAKSGSVVKVSDLGTLATGKHEASWDGRIRGGDLAANGSYRLEISTTDGTLRGLATRTVEVDRRSAKARKPKPEFRRIYPARDGYRDSATVHARLTEQVRWVRVEARWGSQVIRGDKLRRAPEGDVAVAWDGRTNSGRLAPPGRYSVRLVTQDRAGNRSASRAVRLTVSGKELVRRKGTLKVTARESLDSELFDDCSLVAKQTEGKRRGWIGYFSSGTCRSSTAYAVGEHQVRLPKAVRYGTIRISAHGGQHDDRYRDSARLTYFDRLQNISSHSARLRPRLGDHAGPRVRADKLLFRHRVLRWGVVTRDVAWYDVESFTIRYTYDVLR
jgi:subtilisin family serine protease/flagellar hook assembly protein FlgD